MPTPRTSDTNGAGAHGDGGMDLRTAVSLLPTPNASDYKGSGATQGRVRNGKPRPLSDADLPEAVKLLPTPMVGDAKGTRNATAGRKTDNPNVNVGWTLSDVIFDGQLSNPSAPPADAASGCTTPEGSAPDLAAAPALTPNSDGPMKLMPTPTSSDGDRTSSTYGRGNPTLTGAITEPPSDGGKPSSDVPPPGPLTLWDV